MAAENILKRTSVRRARRTGLLSHKLQHIADLSYGQQRTGNLLVQGENLGVLRELAPAFKGQVRCIYIDPPYNNQERYTHYKDCSGHEKWLKEITERLAYLSKFLREDGSLWISIDDREVHYLKVAADKIFGRRNFITTIIWQQRTTRENRKVFSNNHEYLLVYAKDVRQFKACRNPLASTGAVAARYKNPDNDPRGLWQSVSANVQAGHATPVQFYEIVAPGGRRHLPPNGRCWVYNKERMQREIENKNVWFGRNGNGVPRIKRFLSHVREGLTPETLWLASEVGTNKAAKKHLLSLFPGETVFDTPKPEQLIERILLIATNEGDTVLDAYLGSGTTAAVAQKMRRRYVGIEEGSHAVSHCVQRMKQVVEGESGGISKRVNWTGGGGFDFYRLA